VSSKPTDNRKPRPNGQSAGRPKTRNALTGSEGEKAAAEYLRSKGYTVLEMNYRAEGCELDIIAREGDVIIFVEVKTRSGTSHGFPEEAVSPAKQENIGRAAETYLLNHRLENELRFDIISVLNAKGKEPEILHISDAFVPGE
jgi:putative endonuclease